MTVLQGKLADRDAWSAVGQCPIELAMNVVGIRTAMLVLREAFYGTTRFDDFVTRVGMTRAAAAARLRDLVAEGLVERRAYRDAGRRTRQEYVLTDAGRDLVPTVLALFEWGRKYRPGNSHLQLTHNDCGAPVHVQLGCQAGHTVTADDVVVRLA